MTGMEPISPARRSLRWEIAIPIAIAVYFVIVELWSRLFFAGNVPGPYGLLSFHSRAFTYVLLIPLLCIVYLLLVTLKIRRQEWRTALQRLLVIGLMLLISAMLCVWSISGSIHEEAGASLGDETYYLVKDTSPHTGFANLLVVACDSSGLSCRASRYTQIKAQDSARLDISASGDLSVTVCSRLSGTCAVTPPQP